MAQQTDTKPDDKKDKDEFKTGIKPDSAIKIGKLRYATEPEIEADPNALHKVDTVLHELQQWDTVYTINSRLENLGNYGSPTFNLDFPPLPAFGFNFGFNQWDAYRFTADNTRFFNTQNILTDIFYNQGPMDLRNINLLHVQNIKRNWSASIQYHGNASKGYYDWQSTNCSNIAANTWYRSPNRHYMLMASAAWNVFSFQENGGFIKDSLFEALSAAHDKQIVPTHLLNARQSFTDQSYTVNQFWFIGTSETKEFKKDTTKYNIKVLKPRLYVEHRINYYDKKYYYKDSAEGPKPFYPGSINDSAVIHDKYRMMDISNRISIGTALFRDSLSDSGGENINIPFAFSAYARHDIIRATESGIDTFFQNFTVGGTIGGAYSLYKLKLDYTLLGYNAGDYLAQAGLNLKISKHLPVLSLQATAQKAAPAFIMQKMESAYFNWQNNFTKMKFYEFQAGLFNILHTDITARYVMAANYVYMGPEIKPVQADTNINYANLTIFNHLPLGNFRLNTSFTYQKVLQGDFIHLPTYVFRGSYYFEHTAFKKALLFQVGVDIRYYSAYFGNGYMPGISTFYVQDTFKTGNFPTLDFWVAGKIQRFRFYIKLENIAQGFVGPSQWLAPSYPMYLGDLGSVPIRFGIRWMFFD